MAPPLGMCHFAALGMTIRWLCNNRALSLGGVDRVERGC